MCYKRTSGRRPGSLPPGSGVLDYLCLPLDEFHAAESLRVRRRRRERIARARPPRRLRPRSLRRRARRSHRRAASTRGPPADPEHPAEPPLSVAARGRS